VSASLWKKSGFEDELITETAKIKVGPPQDFGNFMGPVMSVVLCFCLEVGVHCFLFSGRPAYDKILSYIHRAKEAGGDILVGGSGGFSVSTNALRGSDDQPLRGRLKGLLHSTDYHIDTRSKVDYHDRRDFWARAHGRCKPLKAFHNLI
jgi:hypothetical protein